MELLNPVSGSVTNFSLKGPKHEIFVAEFFYAIQACMGRCFNVRVWIFFFYYLLGLRATLHLWFLWKKNIQKIDDYDKKSGIHNTIIRVSTYYKNNQLIPLKKIGVRQGIGIRWDGAGEYDAN